MGFEFTVLNWSGEAPTDGDSVYFVDERTVTTAPNLHYVGRVGAVVDHLVSVKVTGMSVKSGRLVPP